MILFLKIEGSSLHRHSWICVANNVCFYALAILEFNSAICYQTLKNRSEKSREVNKNIRQIVIIA